MTRKAMVFFLLIVASFVSSVHGKQKEVSFLYGISPCVTDNKDSPQQTSIVSEHLVVTENSDVKNLQAERDGYTGSIIEQENDEEMDDGIESFVTSVQTSEDVIDACVLARSIQSHFGSSRDMIAIVLGSNNEHGVRLSQQDKQKDWNTLEACGWDVLKFSLPPNQYILRTRRLEWLRIHAWSLTEYKAVVYMEPSSVIISPSVEEMFRCGCFCASIYKVREFSLLSYSLLMASREIILNLT